MTMSVAPRTVVSGYGICWEMENGRVTQIRSLRASNKSFALRDQVQVLVAREQIGVRAGMLGQIEHILEPGFRAGAYPSYVLILSFQAVEACSGHFFSLSEVEPIRRNSGSTSGANVLFKPKPDRIQIKEE